VEMGGSLLPWRFGVFPWGNPSPASPNLALEVSLIQLDESDLRKAKTSPMPQNCNLVGCKGNLWEFHGNFASSGLAFDTFRCAQGN